MMDARQLNLDCDEPRPGEWRVYCTNTRMVLSERCESAEFAWAEAAALLANALNEIRRAACLD